MSAYLRILAAIDLREHSRTVVARACELAQAGRGAVQLLHVVEFVPLEPVDDPVMPLVQVDERMLAQSRLQIEALAREFALPLSACRIETGNAAGAILNCARAHNCDLIVLGSRERHGLSILVNLTEDSVLHGAPCDVLAVRIP